MRSKLTARRKQRMHKLRFFIVTCPMCSGHGRVKMLVGLERKKIVVERCPHCRGQNYWEEPYPIMNMKKWSTKWETIPS